MPREEKLLRTSPTAPTHDRRTLGVVDVLLGLSVLAGTFARIEDGERWTILPPQAGSELVIFIAATAATAARAFPLPALAVAATLDALQHWQHLGGAGIHVAFMICTYMVAAYGPRRIWAVAVAVAFVAQMVFMSWSLDWWWGHAFVMVAGMSAVLPAALGLAARSRRTTVLALQARAEEAERLRQSEARKLLAEDRLRVARDLHDSVAHQIAVMNLNTAVASSALPDRPEDASRALATAREAGRSVITSIGELLSGLREDSWDDLEPSYTVDDLRALVNQFKALLPLVVLETGPELAGSSTISAAPYLVIREGLTNAYKHGVHDAPVRVVLRISGGSYSVCVVNRTTRPGDRFVEGFGLQGMRERVVATGGTLHTSIAGETFVVSAGIPAHPRTGMDGP